MPYWFYEKKELRHTPSIMMGMLQDEETSFRREGARFILQLGNKMGLRYETMATGVVYFHRFYMIHSFQEFPRHVTACCCLFLAGKVEETPKKCKDIMRHARALVDDLTWAEFGADPREEVMTLERILLQTIKFDFIVEHPYTYLLKYAKCLKGDKKKLQSMVQMAWTFVNDGLCTTLCVQWEPEIIAIALMYLAGKLNKFEVIDWQGRTTKQQKWWDMYVAGISMELLEDICHQVLDLYSPNKAEATANVPSVPSSGNANNRRSSIAPVPGSDTAAPSTTPVKGINTANTISGRDVSQSSSQIKSLESGKSSQSGSGSGPPSKKAKKEDTKMDSPPSKPEQSISVVPSVNQAYPYPYPYSSAPGYPPFAPTNTPPVASRSMGYAYQYPTSQPQQATHSPAAQHPGHQLPVTPIASRIPLPAQFSTPTNRYPANTPETTANGRPSGHQYSHPSHVNPHYQTSTPLSSQYPAPASQPGPYSAVAASQPAHYPANAPQQQYAPSQPGRYPSHPPVPHRMPPSAQFPHGSSHPPSSYYPPAQPGSSHSSANYMNYHHQTTNRHYYPPAS